jgi:hypothetical protein
MRPHVSATWVSGIETEQLPIGVVEAEETCFALVDFTYRGKTGRLRFHIFAAVSFAATGKLPVRSGRNGARSLVLLNRVYTGLT